MILTGHWTKNFKIKSCILGVKNFNNVVNKPVPEDADLFDDVDDDMSEDIEVLISSKDSDDDL